MVYHSEILKKKFNFNKCIWFNQKLANCAIFWSASLNNQCYLNKLQ